ncbi:SDR family NAD(P)-dependent oxidoreductase [Halorientalis salina]|uniref:SDR family NAD(P)-dependent oxidoreductase n=1 Tax=Halorientalis salina TaxID=2932266 RepID=UPI0010AC36CC|nr:SDR family NAD(P)-dependent oxidoreductase [Halorientalis salina]
MDVETYESLGGQVALVTGASRGIGEAIAAKLAGLGATVYAGARDTSDLSRSDHRALELDVTSEDDIVDAINRIDDEKGRLDILVNNAGVMDTRVALEEMPTGVIDETFATNLRGPVLLTKYALPLLLLRDGSRVVNVSSGLASLTAEMGRGMAAYRVSKTGLNGLTVYLDGEYHDQGLIANSVCPGWTRTEMGGPYAERSPEEGAEMPVRLARFKPGSPSGEFWRDGQVIDW